MNRTAHLVLFSRSAGYLKSGIRLSIVSGNVKNMNVKSIKKGLKAYDELIARAEEIQKRNQDYDLRIIIQLRKNRALLAARIGRKQSTK
jgi:hypothetical protein